MVWHWIGEKPLPFTWTNDCLLCWRIYASLGLFAIELSYCVYHANKLLMLVCIYLRGKGWTLYQTVPDPARCQWHCFDSGPVMGPISLNVTVYIVNKISIGGGNGSSPIQRQATTWTIAPIYWTPINSSPHSVAYICASDLGQHWFR